MINLIELLGSLSRKIPESQNEFVRNSTPNMSVDELKQLTHSGKFTGTRIDRSLMNELTRKIPSINFTLTEECSIDHLKRHFENDLPTIVLYNCSYMLWKTRIGHAGVVIGIIDDNDLIRGNPWLGPESLVKWKDFLKSWELEYTKVVMLEVD
ncbi:MAG: hypothetical protein U9Q68_01290 [Euryarchaeota archaeon]|nr:hypothetical protein [Euryarchaeota archaeon]